ncbi:MAG: hypothetical protein KJ619_00915 [Candidatus Omnitrophica bacterium]|nr:hypothetical protein [Candidatus Omnitrophota bacterium]MBU2251782.1 hypothetical protein [Candidatus Omnitrophota bacterium]
MITVLVVEDERKIYQLFKEVLSQQGYILIDQPQGRGAVKIVKRVSGDKKLSGEQMFDFENILFKVQEGQVYKAIVEEVEKPLIESILKRVEGNQFKAAKILGINRNTLRTKMKHLGIRPGSWRF